MADEIEDFWPKNFVITAPPAPVDLLKRQADLLGKHTGGQVKGFVNSTVEDETVYYWLSLKADALGDYLYKLLYVAFPTNLDPAHPFPIKAQTVFTAPAQEFPDAESFRKWLERQLSSDRVKATIGNLLRYIRDSQKTSQVS